MNIKIKLCDCKRSGKSTPSCQTCLNITNIVQVFEMDTWEKWRNRTKQNHVFSSFFIILLCNFMLFQLSQFIICSLHLWSCHCFSKLLDIHEFWKKPCMDSFAASPTGHASRAMRRVLSSDISMTFKTKICSFKKLCSNLEPRRQKGARQRRNACPASRRRFFILFASGNTTLKSFEIMEPSTAGWQQ